MSAFHGPLNNNAICYPRQVTLLTRQIFKVKFNLLRPDWAEVTMPANGY